MQFKFLTLATIACFVLSASAAPVGNTSPSDDLVSAGGGVDPNSDLTDSQGNSMDALYGVGALSGSFDLPDRNTNIGAGVGAGVGADTGAGVGADTGAGVGAETGANTGADVAAETGADVAAETGAGLDTGADAGSDIGTNGGVNGGENGSFDAGFDGGYATGVGADYDKTAGDNTASAPPLDIYDSRGSLGSDAATNAGPQ